MINIIFLILAFIVLILVIIVSIWATFEEFIPNACDDDNSKGDRIISGLIAGGLLLISVIAIYTTIVPIVILVNDGYDALIDWINNDDCNCDCNCDGCKRELESLEYVYTK